MYITLDTGEKVKVTPYNLFVKTTLDYFSDDQMDEESRWQDESCKLCYANLWRIISAPYETVGICQNCGNIESLHSG